MKVMYRFLVLVLLCSPWMAAAQTVRGHVYDMQYNLIEGATVRLSPGSHTTQTDRQGAFVITGLPNGLYTLAVTHVGYEVYQHNLSVENNDQSVQVNLITASQQLDEVTITTDHASTLKKEESLNVEVVNSSFIRKNLGGSLMHSLERLPGISIIGIGSGQSKPLIRGLGFNRVVVVDRGVKHEGQQWGADHGLEIDQFAVHQLEIVKGAASFMYGSDAIGGVIDLKPAPIPAANALGGSVDVVGKTNNNLYGGSVNVFARKHKWFFDTRITHQDYADYRVPTDQVSVYTYTVNLHENRLRNTAGTETNVHFNAGYVTDSVRSVFYISNTGSRSGFFANAHGLEPLRVDTELHDKSSRDILYPRQEVNHFKVINRSSFRIKNTLLETELGYQNNFRQEFFDYTPHKYMPPEYPEYMTIPRDLEREFQKHVFSINARDYLWIGKHNVTVGFNGEYQDNAISGWTFLVPAFTQATAGVFVYDKYALTEQTLLHAALRYDYGRITTAEYQDWFQSEVVVDGDTTLQYVQRAQNLTRNFNSVVWSVGLNQAIGRFDVKANVGKSFRMPIAKELAANGVNYHYFSYELGDANLDPEQSYQADLGLSWTDKKWSLSFSPFLNYFSNYIYLNPTYRLDHSTGVGNQVFEYRQSEVLRYGAEVQLHWQFLKSLSTEVLGEYLYARQLSGEKKGYTLPFSPPPSVLFNLTWSPASKGFLREPYFSVDYRLTAQQHNIVPPEKKTPGYQLINLQGGATLQLRDVPVMVNLQVQNLLDTRYMNHTSFYRLIELPEAGRNIILSLKIPFSIKLKQS